MIACLVTYYVLDSVHVSLFRRNFKHSANTFSELGNQPQSPQRFTPDAGTLPAPSKKGKLEFSLQEQNIVPHSDHKRKLGQSVCITAGLEH